MIYHNLQALADAVMSLSPDWWLDGEYWACNSCRAGISNYDEPLICSHDDACGVPFILSWQDQQSKDAGELVMYRAAEIASAISKP